MNFLCLQADQDCIVRSFQLQQCDRGVSLRSTASSISPPTLSKYMSMPSGKHTKTLSENTKVSVLGKLAVANNN